MTDGAADEGAWGVGLATLAEPATGCSTRSSRSPASGSRRPRRRPARASSTPPRPRPWAARSWPPPRRRRAPWRAHGRGRRGARRPPSGAHRAARRLPAPAPALAPAGAAARDHPRRGLRAAQQRRLDDAGPVDPAELAAARLRVPRRPDPARGPRRRQVPAHDRLRGADRGADRRRRPRPPRRAPRGGHDRDARGLRELQRRDARRVDGRGPHQRRASWSATAPTSAAARRSWARCRAAAPR